MSSLNCDSLKSVPEGATGYADTPQGRFFFRDGKVVWARLEGASWLDKLSLDELVKDGAKEGENQDIPSWQYLVDVGYVSADEAEASIDGFIRGAVKLSLGGGGGVEFYALEHGLSSPVALEVEECETAPAVKAPVEPSEPAASEEPTLPPEAAEAPAVTDEELVPLAVAPVQEEFVPVSPMVKETEQPREEAAATAFVCEEDAGFAQPHLSVPGVRSALLLSLNDNTARYGGRLTREEASGVCVVVRGVMSALSGLTGALGEPNLFSAELSGGRLYCKLSGDKALVYLTSESANIGMLRMALAQAKL